MSKPVFVGLICFSCRENCWWKSFHNPISSWSDWGCIITQPSCVFQALFRHSRENMRCCVKIWGDVWKYGVLCENTWISCNIGKSAKNPAGIFGLFYGKAYLHVSIQRWGFCSLFKAFENPGFSLIYFLESYWYNNLCQKTAHIVQCKLLVSFNTKKVRITSLKE